MNLLMTSAKGLVEVVVVKVKIKISFCIEGVVDPGAQVVVNRARRQSKSECRRMIAPIEDRERSLSGERASRAPEKLRRQLLKPIFGARPDSLIELMHPVGVQAFNLVRVI